MEILPQLPGEGRGTIFDFVVCTTKTTIFYVTPNKIYNYQIEFLKPFLKKAL